MSYRTSVVTLLASTAYLAFFLHTMGLAWAFALPMTLGLLIAYVGLARVIAETGVVYMSLPIDQAGFTGLFFHPRDFTGAARTSITLFSALSCQGKAMFMVPLTHAARLADFIKGSPGRLLGGLAVTLAVGVVVNIGYSLHLSYTHGAFNFMDLPFTSYPPTVYDALVAAVKEVPEWKPESYLFLGGGAALFSAMSLLRYRYSWWPVNPLGMIVPVGHAMHSTFSIFLTWGVKALILRIGGARLYRRCRPFFTGMLVGYAMAVFASYVVDQVWFPENGHHMHSW